MSELGNKAGTLDLKFGDQGYADLPKPENAQGIPSSYSWTIDSAGRMIWVAGTFVDNKNYNYWTSLDAQGKPEPGFVEIEDSPIDPELSDEGKIHFITMAKIGGSSRFITHSQCKTFKNNDWSYHAVVGQFQSNYLPLESFGTKGMIRVQPEDESSTPTASSAISEYHRSEADASKETSNSGQLQQAEVKEAAVSAASRSVLVGKTIKTLYASSHFSQPNSQKLWLALHDAETGEPVAGLGPNGDKHQWQIKDFIGSGGPFVPTDAHFFEDGGFALTGMEGTESFVARYKSNGQLDLDFNKSGFMNFGTHNIQLGANEHRIVVALANFISNDPVKLLIKVCDKHTGEPDTAFNGTGTLSIDLDTDAKIRGFHAGTVIIGPTGAIYIAGKLYLFDGSSVSHKGIIYRITHDGKPDVSFGSGGCYLVPDEVTKISDAQLGPNGLRFVAVRNGNTGHCAMQLLI
ncbi:hypothetical protein ACF8EA_10160 [Pseudomonas sp. YQ_5]|uniref:hypothetical protein n=1 Tax=Pseudomonas sp. YQ_5 TaxID=3367229 RepID=UPI00370B618D